MKPADFLQTPSDGILLVDKEPGETSYSVVAHVKRIAGSLGGAKVGHAGTLDPFATGLLVILLGKGTKLSPFLMRGTKIYRATMRVGMETDTYDITGRLVREAAVPQLSKESIQETAGAFIGEIRQRPPSYSALRWKGRRAYELARRGERMDLPERKVTVHDLKILLVDLPDVTMEIECSGGTYIRSLAVDLGKHLGPGACLTSLRRLASGPFNVAHGVASSEISRHMLSDRVISMKDALADMAKVETGRSLAAKIRHGYQPSWGELGGGVEVNGHRSERVRLVNGEELVAVAQVHKGTESCFKVKIERVFN